MKKFTSLLAALFTAVILQGCGSGAGVVPGASVTSVPLNPVSNSTDVAPTITYMGFAVVQQDNGYSAKIVVFFSEDMDPATIASSNFTVRDAGGNVVPGSMLYIGVTAVYTPDQRFQAKSDYSITVGTGVRSLGGIPLADAKTWNFTTPDPSELTGVVVTVASVAPATYAMDIPVNSGVNVTFGQVMDPATINPSTLSVVAPDGTAIAGDVHYTGVTASFVPRAAMNPDTTYRVVVSNGVKSLSGQNMDQPYRSVFTTGSTVQNAAPQVVMTAPMAGDINVNVSGTVVVDFDQAMDTVSVNTSSFQLHDATGALVPGSVIYTGDTAVFTPDAPLLPQVTYTATVSTGATSTGGTALSQPYSWSFTTAAFSQVNAPTVMFSNPGPYDTGVSTSASIDVAFSEVLDPATVTATNVTVTDPDGQAVAGTVSYLNDVVIFTPAAPLLAGATYTVNLSSGIKSRQGAALAPYSWSFTTMWSF